MTSPLFTGSEEVPRMFSHIFGVRTEVTVPQVRDIRKVRTPPSNLVLEDPSSILGGPFLSPGVLKETPNPLNTPTSNLSKTRIADRLEAWDTVLPCNSNSSCKLDLPKARIGLKVQLDVLL